MNNFHLKSISLISTLLLASGSGLSQTKIDGLNLVESNPLTPFALKENGDGRNNFKVPFSALAQYYQYASHGYILENPNSEPIFSLDMDVMGDKSKDNIEFKVNLKKKQIYPTEVINPHSVSTLFVLDPQIYNSLADSPDFLSAKQKVYKAKTFDRKKLKYDFQFAHLEDWRSLNHPPVSDLGGDLTIWDKDLFPIDFSKKDSVFYSPDFQKKIDTLSNTELSFGNKVELLENGLSFKRKLIEVKKAKSSVLMAVMSFFCDPSSRLLEDALIQKAQSGVDVKLIMEKIWTNISSRKCLNRMRKGGVDIALANDLLKKGDEMALFHDKFMIIDGRILIMGGANIMTSDNISTGMNHLNRDNDVIAEGPVATDATLAFVELWRRFSRKINTELMDRDPRVKDISVYESEALAQKKIDTEEKLRGQDIYESKLASVDSRSKGSCRFLNQSPSTDKHKLSKVYIEFIGASNERMSMTNGNTFYFDLPEHKEKERARDTWNKKLYRSIFSSIERGVKLDIIGNGIDGGYGEASNLFKRVYLKNRFKANPIPRTIAAFLSGFMDKMAAKTNQPFLENLARRENVRAWTHFQYMHSKKMQIDRIVSMVSSYNLDEWSADKSHETSLICMDDSLNTQMERSFLQDIVNSQPVGLTQRD